MVLTTILLSDISIEKNQEPARGRTSPDQPVVDGIEKPDASNFNEQASPRLGRLSSSKGPQSQRLPPPDLAPPPRFVSPLFYETVRNTQPPNSCLTPSSTGATTGANSSSNASKQSDDSTSPLMHMSAQHDLNDGDHPPEQAPSAPSSSASFRPPHNASYQRSFQRQPFPAQPYYPGHSASPQEQAYAPPAPYAQQPAPGPGFMGQYMASQPSLSMAMQSPVQFGYSHSFAHPGIHAQDTSSLGMPFGQHQHNRGYAYPHPPGPSSEGRGGDRGSRSGQGYAGSSSPFAEPTVASQPVPASSASASHMSHHGYSPMHYSQPSPSPHYPGYPAHSFTHSSPGLYAFAPPPAPYPQSFYGQPPASPEDASKGGGWWYLPPGGTQQYDSSAYQANYQMAGYPPSMQQQMGHPDFDPYASQPGPSSPPPFAGPSNQQAMRLPPGTAPARERPLLPSSPVVPRAASDAPRADAASPISKKRSPHDTVSASPPAASRKSYHPNPPSNRSEWVMWVGNVPSDATHDELWRFFNQPAPAHVPPPGTSAMLSSRQVQPDDDRGGEERGEVWGGVASVFLISRSNCAFVNFETEQHLARAVVHFNGKPVRPRDPRCPRLVCRVRRKDDDLKAGVGGQRGMGLHTRWVAEQKERGRERAQQKDKDKDNVSGGEDGDEDTESSGEGPPTSPSTYLAPSNSSDPSPPILAVSPKDDPSSVQISGSQQLPDREPRHGSSGNQSFTSTNSSFLANNFPKRYFILKSLTQYDLNLSLDRGIWATQPHNEGILDQAYRTSTDVFLIFGANKSGEFFGYARMAGPIFHNERVDHVSWASRSSGQGSVSGARGGPEAIKEEDESSNILPSAEHRLVDESPAPVTPGEDARLHQVSSKIGTTPKLDSDAATAPAVMHKAHRPISVAHHPRAVETLPEQRRKQSLALDARAKPMSEGFVLRSPPRPVDSANIQAQRDSFVKMSPSAADEYGVLRKDTFVTLDDVRRQQNKDAAHALDASAITAKNLPTAQRTEEGENLDKPEGWGREFKIEWLRTERLPFHRTRHLRNPWNHDREVKVSRDGTELEPVVGQRLLDEWDTLPETEGSPPTSPASRGRGSRVPLRSASALAAVSMPSSSSSQTYRAGPSGATGQGRGRQS